MTKHLYPVDSLPIRVGTIAMCGHVAEVQTDHEYIGPGDKRCEKCLSAMFGIVAYQIGA